MKAPKALVAVLLLAGVWAGEPFAQSYPARPIRILVSSSAGGSPDIQTRLFTQKMSEAHGYTWAIEHVPGAGGNIAPDRVAKSAPDGYTLLVASAGPLYINPSLYSRLPYDILRDFEHITQIAQTPNVLAVHPSLPFRTVKDLVDYARKNPGKLRFGSAGSGSSQHLSAELFKSMTGIDIEHIPYKSSSQMTNELIGGQIELSFQNVPLVLPYVKSGKLRALAVTSKSRLPAAPDLPTIDGSGVPGYEAGGGTGFLAPKGTPAAIVSKLAADARAAINDPKVREQFVNNGLIPVGNSPEAFAAALKAEIARLAPIVRASGAKVE